MDKTILIQIPAYKDRDLLNTVYSALQQANFPERVHFAICYQSDDMRMYHQLQSIPNMKIKLVAPKDARGACYARWCCQQLIDWEDPEDFTFHTDAHMRFCKGWDDHMIEDYMPFYEKDPMAILSAYPPSSNHYLDKKFDDPVFDVPGGAQAMRTFGFHDAKGHFVRIQAENLAENDPRVGSRNVFVSGGYFFSDIYVDKVVLYDRYMLQLGDELPYSVRLFTHGYNVYIPVKQYAYHEYTRPDRECPVMTADDSNVELRRIETLFEICEEKDCVDLGEFGNGDVRTMRDYTNFCGIDFKNHTIQVRSNRAYYDKNAIAGGNKVCVHSRYESQVRQSILKHKIHVVCLYLSDKTYDSIGFTAHCREMADRNEMVYIYNVIAKENELYGSVLSRGLQMLKKKASPNDYVLFVGSDTRFLRHWDSYLIDSLSKCGSQAVLSNTSVNIDLKKHKLDKLPIFDNFYVKFNTNSMKNSNSYFYVKLANNDIPYFDVVRSKMNMSQKLPTRHLVLGFNFLFGRYRTFSMIPFDPSLCYRDHCILYSARLFTHGIDIYYPVHSYVMNYETNQVISDRDKANDKRELLKYLLWDRFYDMEPYFVDYPYSMGDIRYVKQFLKELDVDIEKRHVTIKDI